MRNTKYTGRRTPIEDRAGSTSKIGERSMNNSMHRGKGSITEFNSTPINGVEELRAAYLTRGPE